MRSFSELEQEAMKLPEAQRATLACRLLDERNPGAGLSLEELRRMLR